MQTRRASALDARAYLVKAREYLRASTHSLDDGNYIAATGNAIHAGIAAADAVAAAQTGAVWQGAHTQAPTYLEKVVRPDGPQAARHLRRLVPLKSRAEYDPVPIPPSDATSAVESARRLVAIAEQVVGAAET